MVFSATPVGQADAQLFSIYTVRRIKAQGTGSIITFSNQQPSVSVTETPTAIFDQQNAGSNKSVGMLLLTENKTGDKIIIPTHVVKEIVAYTFPAIDPDPAVVGAKVNLIADDQTQFVNESLATIIGWQDPQVLGLILVTRASDSKKFILGRTQIERIVKEGSGAKIFRMAGLKPLVVTESVATIFAAIP